MAIKSPVLSSKPGKLVFQNVVDRLGTDVGIRLLAGEEPTGPGCAAIILTDIIGQKSQCFGRKYRIAVGTVFAATDIDTVLFGMDVAAMKTAEFTDPEPRGIKDCNRCFMLGVCDRSNDGIHFLTGRDSGKVLVKAEIRHLVTVPVPVKDIKKEIAQLGNMDIDGAVIQFADVFKISDVGTNLLVSNP